MSDFMLQIQRIRVKRKPFAVTSAYMKKEYRRIFYKRS